jgi:cysteine desulfurase
MTLNPLVMIYLDYNSTTPVLPAVREAMWPFFNEEWGNPSSIYRLGARAKSAIEVARAQVAALVGADSTEIIFTSCATEANNAAINSALLAAPQKRHVVTSQVEHSSVLHYCEGLAKKGRSVTFLSVSRNGLVDLEDLEKAIQEETAVVSLMWANNETGVISPVREIGEICAKRGVLFHCDAVQAVGKMPVSFSEMPIDFLSISGHKLGAPKGIGALVVRHSVPFHPLIVGGKQESGRRGGTESAPLIVGFGAACEIASKQSLTAWKRVEAMRDELQTNLLIMLRGAYSNGGSAPRLPNTLNIGIAGIDSDALVTYCDRNGVCVSSGSACMESAIAPSHVLLAMNGSHKQASEAVRVSLGLETKSEELDRLPVLLRQFVDLSL